MGRRVEVLALFPGAAALDVVHAHGDGVVVGVDHGAVCGVGEAAVVLAPGAVSPLIFPTHLETNSNNINDSTRSRKSTETYAHSTPQRLRIQQFVALCSHAEYIGYDSSSLRMKLNTNIHLSEK